MEKHQVEAKIVEVLKNYFERNQECSVCSFEDAVWGKDVKVAGVGQYLNNEITVKDINARGMGYVDGIRYSGQEILPENCNFYFIIGEGITELGKKGWSEAEGSGEFTYLVAICGDYLYLLGCSFSAPEDWWLEMKSYVMWEKLF